MTSPYLNRPLRPRAKVECIYTKLRDIEQRISDLQWEGAATPCLDAEARRLRKLLRDGQTEEPNF
jgi:hypothetical protein